MISCKYAGFDPNPDKSVVEEELLSVEQQQAMEESERRLAQLDDTDIKTLVRLVLERRWSE